MLFYQLVLLGVPGTERAGGGGQLGGGGEIPFVEKGRCSAEKQSATASIGA